MDMIPFAIIALTFTGLAFHLGRASAKEPSGEEMLRRLVRMRVEARVEKNAGQELNAEIEAAVDRLSRRGGRAVPGTYTEAKFNG